MAEIGRIRKTDTTDVVVSLTEYKGQLGLDIREYIKSERYTGWSKSGTRIPKDQICELGKLINQACEQVSQ